MATKYTLQWSLHGALACLWDVDSMRCCATVSLMSISPWNGRAPSIDNMPTQKIQDPSRYMQLPRAFSSTTLLTPFHVWSTIFLGMGVVAFRGNDRSLILKSESKLLFHVQLCLEIIWKTFGAANSALSTFGKLGLLSDLEIYREGSGDEHFHVLLEMRGA